MLENYQEAYQKLMQNSCDDMQALRTREFSHFLLHGIPKRTQENWKYTDISALENSAFALSKQQVMHSDLPIEKYYLPASYNLVCVNGYFATQLSSLHKLPAGVILTSVNDACKRFPELINQYLQKTITQPLASLNLALMSDGLFLYIPKSLLLDKPIQLLHVTTAESQDCMQHLRNVVIVDEGAQAEVIEHYISIADIKYFNNIVTQIYVNKSANLNFYKYQNESREAYHMANTQIMQQGKSQFNSYVFSLGSKLARDDLTVSLNEAGAHCVLQGLYMVHDKQHIDHHTRIDHYAAHCNSRETYKGILDGKATGVFNGKVIVHKGAQQTKTQQTNQNLLLSKAAEMNAKPELEIYADDVQCSHGATVGQMDEAALFYLRSRGIEAAAARNMLTYAFMSEIVDALPNAIIKEFFKKHLQS